MSSRTLHNFGRNVAFTPTAAYAPKSEAEVLDILERHAGDRIRAVGSLHSWSRAAATNGVSVDLRHLDDVEAMRDDEGGDHRARVGAGCTIRRLVRELREHDLTLPSLGLIQAQTVAGATATATHGSGKNSLSQYVLEARVAHYDEAGKAVISVIAGGEALEAVRCSLGMLGIVTQLTLRARPTYAIEEVFRLHRTLETVLAVEERYPLQQSYLIPWSWQWVVQRRRETTKDRSWTAPLYRAYWAVVMDAGLHLFILALARVLRSDGMVRGFFRYLSHLFVIRRWTVVDRSDRQLTMNHDLFRHVEVELFVERDEVVAACSLLKSMLRHFGGQAISEEARAQLVGAALWERTAAMHGAYTHHYPICIRKVVPDDAHLSMAQGSDQARYAISIISYAGSRDRAVFYDVAALLTDALGQLFGARPHWGKLCSLDAGQVRELYPRLPEFLGVARAMDPDGRFGNAWTDELFDNEA